MLLTLTRPSRKSPDLRTGRTQPNGGQNISGGKFQTIAAQEKRGSANPRLKSQLSAVLRDQLISELKHVSSTDAAAIWARRILPAKNSLNVVDARQLENAFQTRLAELERGADDARRSSLGSMRKLTTPPEREGSEPAKTSTVQRIERSGLTHPEPRRARDREHLKFVAGPPCLTRTDTKAVEEAFQARLEVLEVGGVIAPVVAEPHMGPATSYDPNRTAPNRKNDGVLVRS